MINMLKHNAHRFYVYILERMLLPAALFGLVACAAAGHMFSNKKDKTAKTENDVHIYVVPNDQSGNSKYDDEKIVPLNAENPKATKI